MAVATEPAHEIDPTAKAEGLLYGKPPKPVCPMHQITMRAGSSPTKPRPGTYWYCPVPTCGCSKYTRRERRVYRDM